MKAIVRTDATPWVILIRVMVGAVFLSEGLQKFLFSERVGPGRFSKIGLPSPEVLAPFVGCIEIVSGILILLGLLTRVAVLPTITIMLVAIATTKVPILLNQGFWVLAHEARTDFSMLLGSVFLLIVGSGCCSLDEKWGSSPFGVGSSESISKQ